MEKRDKSLEEFFQELEEKERSLSINGENSVELEIEVYEDGSGFADSWMSDFSEIKRIEDSQIKIQRNLIEKEREELDRRVKDFENYRRRFELERSKVTENLVTDLVKRLLPVVDNLERAIEASRRNPSLMTEDFQKFLDGIVMINQQLYEILAEMGVEPIKALGMPFDPNFHEAVEVETNHQLPNNTIISELLRGYKIGDRVIRHALVKVAVRHS